MVWQFSKVSHGYVKFQKSILKKEMKSEYKYEIYEEGRLAKSFYRIQV